jgi:aminocarboxymuconate-semialdehyde decarboxylase
VTGDEWSPEVVWENGRQYVDFEGKRINSALREFCDIETILVEQDKAGVGKLVLTPWSSLFRYEAEVATSLRVNQIQNEAMARLVENYGDRIVGLGTVPMQDGETAVAELMRCMQELGLKGVEIGTNVNGKYLGDAAFRPFWAAAEKLGAVVQIHPVPGIGGPTNREFYLWNAFANPAETALTASHMILSGLLEEHPGLRICLVHGGGHLPYQIGRLDRAYEMRPEASKHISQPPSYYFKQLYFDTVVHSTQALSYLVDLVGVDRVMVGSDYPFDMGSERPSEIVHALDLTEAEKAEILHENAAKLFAV